MPYTKKLALSAALFLFAASPFIASAQSVSDLQAQIAQLVATVQSLQAQLAATQGGSATSSGSDLSCLNLSNNLYAGMTDAQSGGQVSKLQRYLGISPATGYFGPATIQAVQNWQSSHGVVSSGTPDTTGFGFVGPATRAAMVCDKATVPTTSVAASDSIAVTAPAAGQAFAVGNTMNIQWTDNGPDINSPHYYIVLWPSTYPSGSGWPLAGTGYSLQDVTANHFSWTVDSRPSPGTYIVRVCRLGENVCGMSDRFTIGNSSNATQPSVTINQSSLSTGSANPIITGFATGLSEFTIGLSGGPCNSGGWATVVSGRWSWPAGGVPLNLAPGTCTVSIRATQTSPVLATGTLVVSSATTVAASATIDQSSLSAISATPTITGTASGVSVVVLTASNGNGYAYVGGPVQVVNGRWTIKMPSLPNGTFSLSLSDNDSPGTAQSAASIATATLSVQVAPVPTVAAFSESAALGFIKSLYSPSQQLVKACTSCSISYLWSDNFLAQIVLRGMDPNDAAAIESKMNSYGIAMHSAWAPLDPRYLASAFFGGVTDTAVPGATNIQYSDYSTSGSLSCADYADIAFLEAIYKFKKGDSAGALSCYNLGKAKWDGIGMQEAWQPKGTYNVYKTALGLLAQKVTGFAAIGIPDNYFDKYQSANGGILTDIAGGQPSGTQNVETTAAVLLAKDPSLVNNLPPTAVPVYLPPSPVSTTLPAPAGLNATCNSTGTQVTLSWNPVSGATFYKPRIAVPAGSALCQSFGWQLYTDGTTCYPNPDTYASTAVRSFPVASGISYAWWVEGDSSSMTGTVAKSTLLCATGQQAAALDAARAAVAALQAAFNRLFGD